MVEWIAPLGTKMNPDTFRIRFDLNTIRVDVDIFESGKKKLRIQKYLDTCGRGLRWLIEWNDSDIARYANFLISIFGLALAQRRVLFQPRYTN